MTETRSCLGQFGAKLKVAAASRAYFSASKLHFGNLWVTSIVTAIGYKPPDLRSQIMHQAFSTMSHRAQEKTSN